MKMKRWLIRNRFRFLWPFIVGFVVIFIKTNDPWWFYPGMAFVLLGWLYFFLVVEDD